MGKASIKENKNIYFQKRESLNLTRDKASLLTKLPSERIERIENDKIEPLASDVLALAEGYKAPELCNYYCSKECPIGKTYVPEIEIKDLSVIVLEMLSSLNSLKRKQETLIDISTDGKISDEEIKDFIEIQKELSRISITVDTLDLWTKKMLSEGKINIDKYNEYLNK